MKTIYADSVGTIHYRGGMIRIECSNMKAEGENITNETHTTLIMPVSGFLKSLASCGELVEKMKEAGIVTEKKEGETNE
jgi:hypothetical protein